MRKKFGKVFYSGKVASISEGEGGKTLYRINYDDGDEEDLYYADLLPLLTTSVSGHPIC